MIDILLYKSFYKFSIYSLFVFILTTNAFCKTLAPVSGFARSFITNTALNNATIKIIETGEQYKTDHQGHFGPFLYPVGSPLTLELSKFGYKTTQSETIVMPAEGLTGDYHQITFQVPSTLAYYLIAAIVGAKINDECCHVATTITAYHKTLDMVPQGETEAQIILTPTTHEQPFYFDIFEKSPLKGMTNPFTKGLSSTTADGGAAFFNLPASDQLYKISAVKAGKKFTEATFWCRRGAFINISPPRGPSVRPNL